MMQTGAAGVTWDLGPSAVDVETVAVFYYPGVHTAGALKE